MSKIFVSCGQYTKPEKALGAKIVEVVKSITGLDAFFAEQVQDLNGLDSNILAALRDCAAFITVLHPRGEIRRPDGSVHVRASVWIEQEIAIATYIQRVEKRSLPVIAFVHKSVGREGIRELLHLNPIPFTSEDEVILELSSRLQSWKTLINGGTHLQLKANQRSLEEGHWIRKAIVTLVNDSNQRIDSFNCRVIVPIGLLKHWNMVFPTEAKSTDSRYRVFEIDEHRKGAMLPRSSLELFSFPYCTLCAAEHAGESSTVAAALASESKIEVKVWIEGREYEAANTVKELCEDADKSVA